MQRALVTLAKGSIIVGLITLWDEFESAASATMAKKLSQTQLK